MRGGLATTSATTMPGARVSTSTSGIRASSGWKPIEVALMRTPVPCGTCRAGSQGRYRAAAGVRSSMRSASAWPRSGCPVDDRDAPRAGERRLDGDGASGTAGAEDHHVLPGGIGDGAQGGDEALPVRVLADQPAVADDDGVDRSDDGGRRRELVEQVEHGDLVGDGAVEADPAHGLGSADRAGQVLGGHLAVDVAHVQPGVGEGRLHDRDGRVLRRGRRERAGQPAQEGRSDMGSPVLVGTRAYPRTLHPGARECGP